MSVKNCQSFLSLGVWKPESSVPLFMLWKAGSDLGTSYDSGAMSRGKMKKTNNLLGEGEWKDFPLPKISMDEPSWLLTADCREKIFPPPPHLPTSLIFPPRARYNAMHMLQTDNEVSSLKWCTHLRWISTSLNSWWYMTTSWTKVYGVCPVGYTMNYCC